MNLGTAYVVIKGKATGLKKDLAAARTDTKTAIGRMQKRIDSINWRAAGVAAVAFGGIVTLGIKKAIDAASDLEETTGKFNVVFKDQSDAAEDMADTLVESYAMSTEEARRFLSSIQDLLVPMGMNSDAAAKM